MRVFFVSFLVLYFLSSCYERVEGCLDPLASNYNQNADDPCEDCCTNPTIKLTIKHQLSDTFYNPLDSVRNNLNQWYKLLDFQYYLSGFQGIAADGSSIRGVKQIEYIHQGNLLRATDDFILVSPSLFDYTVTEIRQFGSYDSLQFTMGLEASIRGASEIKVSDDHVLSNDKFLINNDDQKGWCAFTLAKGVGFRDTLRIFYTTEDKESNIHLALPAKNAIGANLSYAMVADYSYCFKNIDLNQSPELIKAALRENLKDAFFVE